jgi:phospholipid/cholesterol/gamma-HCH transport system substrate-binding protein
MTYNPQAGTLDTRSNQGETPGQILADPAAFLCGIAGQVDDSGAFCDQIKQAKFPKAPTKLPRAATFGQGGANWQDQFDPSLGGLVEVPR